MISLEAARALITTATHVLPPERIPLTQVLGRTLRESVAAVEDFPAFDRSAFDGYAVRSADVPEKLRVVAEVSAGVGSAQIGSGECARIFTGAQLPVGADAVIMQEDCRREGDTVSQLPAAFSASLRIPTLNFQLTKWQGVRRRGEDATAGTTLLHRGTRLGAVETSLLAQLGHVLPLVGSEPRIFHITTGSELVPPDDTPGPGKIRDSNSTLIASLATEFGARVISQARVTDDLQLLLATIGSVPHSDWDLLLISGGASVGDYDFGARALVALGFSIHFSQINLRPGKPLIFATRGRQLAFVIPGNPLSHLVCWHVAIRAALQILIAGETELPLFPVVAADLVPGNPRETWWPARLSIVDGKAVALPLKWRSSGDMSAMSGADLLLRIPMEGVSAGGVVEALRLE